jgi:hypothetical protein
MDWTTGEDGRANTSEAFGRVVGAVEAIIRNSAHNLIAGRAETVAQLVVAKLAHEHGLAPVPRSLPEGGAPVGGVETTRRIYAVGPTPEDAIRALAAERKWGAVEMGSDLEGGDEPDLGWGRFFSAGGTGMKAAGCHVPGGAAVLWWK